jgi:hypothetical protein
MWKCPLAIALFALATAASATETSYTGETVIRSIGPLRIAVFIDSNGDHMIDNGFLLTTDIPMHGSMAVHLPTAKLSVTEGYVRVATETKIYDLEVAGYPESPARPDGVEVVTMIGSALQHSRGESGCDIRRAHEGDAGNCYSYGSE